MNVNHFVADVTDQLADWGVNYSENVAGLRVGAVDLEISEGDSAATITNGDGVVAITSDADKAAALLAFPLARRAWECGYAGGFQVTYVDGGEVEMTLSYESSDLTISAGVNESDRFTITEHDLFRQTVCMSDLEAVLTSTELAYSNPDEAWQALCGASDFEADHWGEIVIFFDGDARIYQGDRYSRVESCKSERIALVEDDGPDSPICIIDVDAFSDTTVWAPSDVAAAVLYMIS